jgi:hypothetical protein
MTGPSIGTWHLSGSTQESNRMPEIQIELQPTDEYRAAKKALSPRLRRFVGYVEQDIADNPTHVKWRRRLSDGTMLDYAGATDGFLIRYRILSASIVELVELIDVRPFGRGASN